MTDEPGFLTMKYKVNVDLFTDWTHGIEINTTGRWAIKADSMRNTDLSMVTGEHSFP